MASFTFPIVSYRIQTARSMTASATGGGIRFHSYLTASGTEYHVVIYALHEDSHVPPNTFSAASKRGTMFLPRWHFDFIVEMLRYEQPVYCTLYDSSPDGHVLHTGSEPVGEQEL